MRERRGPRIVDHGPTPSPYGDQLESHLADIERLRVRASQLLAKHGLSIDEYAAIFSAQHGRCAVCKNHETSTFRGKRRNLTVDKDAEGRVRGLLCDACHKRIRSFEDEQALLDWTERALGYLR